MKENEYLYWIQPVNNNCVKIGKSTRKNRKNEHSSSSAGIEMKNVFDNTYIEKIQNEEIRNSKDPDTTLRNKLWEDSEFRNIAYWNKNKQDVATIESAKKNGISLSHDETFWPKDEVSYNKFCEVLCKCVSKILCYEEDINRKNTIILAQFQENIFSKILEALLSGKNVLLDCVPRDGKSMLAIRAMKALNKKHPIILSWWIAPDSFKKELAYRGYENYSFVMYNSLLFKEIMKTGEWKDGEVLYISAQTFQRLSDDELSVLAQYVDLIIKDEVHNGTDTRRFLKAFNKIYHDDILQIDISGTPYNDLLGSRYSDETKWCHIRHSIIDRMYDKLMASDKDVFTKCFPYINMFKIQSLHQLAIEKFYKEFSGACEFSWEKFLCQASDTTIKEFLSTAFYSNKGMFAGDDRRSLSNILSFYNTKNIIISVDKIDIVERLYKLLNDLKLTDKKFKDFNIATLTGKYQNEVKKVSIDKTTYVNEMFEKNKGSFNIVLTVDAGMTGKTYEEANCFIFLRSIKSSERIDQYYARVLTPLIGKDQVSIIFADSQQYDVAVGQLVDGIYYSSNQDQNVTREKVKVVLNKCISFINIDEDDETFLQFREMDVDEIFQIHNNYCREHHDINLTNIIYNMRDRNINFYNCGYFDMIDIESLINKKMKLSKHIENKIGEDDKTAGRKNTSTSYNNDKEKKNEEQFTIDEKVIITICQNLQFIRCYLIDQFDDEDEGCKKLMNGEMPSEDWWNKIDVIQFAPDKKYKISGKNFFQILKELKLVRDFESEIKRFAYLEENSIYFL